MKVRLISLTQPIAPEVQGRDAEGLMIWIARVSSPNQSNENIAGLLKYCLRNGHWSVFEHAHMTIEVETSRAIAAQILRHRSFSFQEFSQRYAVATEFETVPIPGKQGTKNRQKGEPETSWWKIYLWNLLYLIVHWVSFVAYRACLKLGVAKEDARFLLPLSTRTRLYMTGSVRSWVHYLQLRDHDHAQRQHRQVAQEIKAIFRERFPVTTEALEW